MSMLTFKKITILALFDRLYAVKRGTLQYSAFDLDSCSLKNENFSYNKIYGG